VTIKSADASRNVGEDAILPAERSSLFSRRSRHHPDKESKNKYKTFNAEDKERRGRWRSIKYSPKKKIILRSIEKSTDGISR